jgi:hypothetical protein
MAYRAALLRYDHIDNPAPTAKEIQNYFKKSTRLLYGNDKRKSKSTPIPDKIHLVSRSFDTFKVALTGADYISTMLYVFDDQANSSMLGLKYANQVVCHFKLDDLITDEMWNISWGYGHLLRYKRGLQSEIDSTEFLAEKNVGSKTFHAKAVPLFVNATQAFILKVGQEMAALESEAKRLFYSGWD